MSEIIKPSSHRVEVVPIILEKHPNADLLSVAKVYGYTCVTQTAQWAGKTLAAYIPPDSLVPITRPEFEFLASKANQDGMARIKAMKLRGVLSFGLLVPAPEGSKEGDDVAELLGVKHYEPPVKGSGSHNMPGLFPSGEVTGAPNVYHVKYDLEDGRRYGLMVFEPGESVWIGEKIDGSNARYVFHDGKMFCGSRTEWKKEYPNYDHVTVELVYTNLLATGKVTEDEAKQKSENIVAKLHKSNEKPVRNMWWTALDNTPEVRAFCEKHPDVVVYGECYGGVGGMNYGLNVSKVKLAVFDMMKDGKWFDSCLLHTLCEEWGLPIPPLFGNAVPFNFDEVCALAEGKTHMPGANHVREGVVVKPDVERWDHRVGRVALKWRGVGYFEKQKEDKS